MKTTLTWALGVAIAGASLNSVAVGIDETKIKEVMRQALKDPDSAKLQDLTSGVFFNGKENHRYVCGLVNAKNAYGAYSGYEPFVIVLASEGGDPQQRDLLDISSYAAELCEKLKKTPAK